MAANQLPSDLSGNSPLDENPSQPIRQPENTTTASQSTVSQDLFTNSTQLTAIDLALHELLETIAEATELRARSNVQPRLLRSHIAALQEDAELVASFEAKTDEIRAKITQAVLQARKLRRQLERDIIEYETQREAASRNEQAQVQVIQLDTNRTTGIKLTPLKPPTFNGDASQFSVFKEFFEENVMNNDQLTDTAKWLRLTESLTGAPAELLSELPRTTQTLPIAWNLLLETFSADDRPIATLYDKLQKLPQAVMTTASLKMTHSKLEGVLMTLEHLGHEVGENGYVRWLYMNKFPMDIAYQVQKRRNIPLAELRKSIGEVIRAREGADQQVGQPTFAAPQMEARRTAPRAPIGDAAPAKKATVNAIRVCAFCSADHWNDMCATYSTIEARKQRLAGKCFRCFRRVHDGSCVSPRRCFHCDSAEYNRALCPTKFGKLAKEKRAVVQAAIVTERQSAAAMGYFLAFTAYASSPSARQPMELRVIIDTGGGSTVVRREVADRLRIPVKNKSSTAYMGLGGAHLIKSYPLEMPLQLKTKDGAEVEVQAEAVDWIIPEVPTPDVEKLREEYPKLKDVYIPSTGQGRPIDLLIGSDMVVKLLLPEAIQRISDDLSLMPTVFGSLIVGRNRGQQSKVGFNLLFSPHTDPLYQMCNLDLVGLAGLHSSDIDDEQQAIKNFYDTVKFTEGRYSISWPWRAVPPNLDTNFGLALGRLKTLHRKLSNSPKLLLEYHKIIQKQLESGVIETVDRERAAAEIVHYVPHHPVLQPEKEIRPVYDGSSKPGKMKKSLNDNILKGKNWLNDLVKTLLRFRRYKNAVISDIAKAFHQIAINNDDRDAVRFIWLKDPLQQPTNENLQIYRFTRVAFGIVASPFILSATIQFHASKQEPNEFTGIILQDMYADNLVAALPDTVDLQEFYTYSKAFFASMSMNLTKWATNNENLRQHIPEPDQVPEIIQSVLGLKWNIQKDVFRFKPPKIQPTLTPTRRIVASEMAAYFDPMGWAVPILLIAKNFFRKLWAETKSWDEQLSSAHRQEWAEIVKKLQKITCIELPRQLRIFPGQQEYQLHAFVDASATAYAVAVYLRVQQAEKVQLSMVAAKSRLTPLKSITIPKLELIAILLGCRFTHFVKTTLNLPHATTFIWSDSKCALSWMRQDKILPTAVERYIKEAKTYRIDNLRYVPTDRNFADVATRGADFQSLVDMNWWTGPEWLYHEQDWPKLDEPIEINHQTSLIFQTQLMTRKEPMREEEIEGICKVNIKNFATLAQLLIRTAYILKAMVRLLKNNFLQLQTELDTALALKLWLRWDQKRYYALQEEPTAHKKFWIRNISVFRDKDEVIRCQTRLKNSFLNIDTVTPILLVQSSTLTKLIILQAHTQNKHAGTNHTLAVLRQRYWLPQGRPQVYKTIVNECFVCRRHIAQAYPNPPAAPLPEFRVLRVQKPFQAIGVDVFGPFMVRQVTLTGFQKETRWSLIFTCATVRAVHLETITEMTTTEISYAFRRFFARRGTPRKIISDNAPQFHVLDGHFRNLWRTVSRAPSVSAYFAENQIEWDFTPELAPWMGSIYERLIQSIKKAFEKTYGDKTLTSKQFDLAMIEIEAVINSRPIAYVDRDPECPIITPNDFLSAKFSAIPIKQTANETDDILVKLWKSSQDYLDQFWECWSTQYIMLLRERNDQLKHRRRNAGQTPAKGDIVIMQDLTKKRSSWQLAIVERMIASKDGEVRSVQIRIPNGARLIRPVIALAPLGLNIDLPKVKDDQLTKRKDAIVVWPLEDVPLENEDERDVNPNALHRNETPPLPAQSDAEQRRMDAAGEQLHF